MPLPRSRQSAHSSLEVLTTLFDLPPLRSRLNVLAQGIACTQQRRRPPQKGRGMMRGHKPDQQGRQADATAHHEQGPTPGGLGNAQLRPKTD
jgi:hypothetical protein